MENGSTETVEGVEGANLIDMHQKTPQKGTRKLLRKESENFHSLSIENNPRRFDIVFLPPHWTSAKPFCNSTTVFRAVSLPQHASIGEHH